MMPPDDRAASENPLTNYPGLNADPDATGVGPTSGDPDATRWTAPTPDPVPTPTSGPSRFAEGRPTRRRLGEYELLERIGQGGMGVVYRATQHSLDRVVAVKMIAAGLLAGEEAISLFRNEARTAARLEHPHIVTVHEAGEDDGRYFLVMDYVAGGSLQDWLKREQRPLDPHQAAEFVRQIADAVQHAHERGILHRDIKPGNVLLASAESTTVKLTDFGLARAGEPGLSRTGQALGTPGYMPPEQARGDWERVDERSDVYSLGALLYCLLTSRAPFQAASDVETLRQVCETEPVPLRQLNPSVPRDLETVCLKCLAKERERRYGSARELMEELARFLRGEPVRAHRARLTERAWRWCRRNPLITGLLAAVVLSLVGGIVVASYFAVEEARAKWKAVQALTEAVQRKEEAEWLAYTGHISLAQRAWQDGKVGHARALLHGCQWDLRGWEHDYLHTLFNASQRTFVGHTNTINSVCFSPDGKRLASASYDRTVKVWDLSSGREILTLKGHTNPITSVCFSHDGTRLASASYDRTVKVWDACSGVEMLTLKGHTSIVWSVCFNLDGTRLATASADKTVKIWNARSGQEERTLQGHTEPVESVCFSPDESRLASSSDDETVKIWNARTGQEERTLKGHTGIVWRAVFSPDGMRLASSSEDKTVKVWDAHSGKELFALKSHTNSVESVSFSPDGNRLASASWDKSVKIWDAHSGQETLTLKGHTDAVTSVCFSPEGNTLASASWDKTAKVWDLFSGQKTLTFKEHTGPVRSVAFNADGTRLATASWDRTIKVMEAASGRVALVLKGHAGPVRSVCFSSDGQRLASASEDRTIKIWDALTGQETLTLQGHADAVTSVVFSPDGNRLASASWDKTVKIWDAHSGQETLVLKGHTDAVTSVCFSPTENRVASASRDKSVRLWDPVSGRETMTIKGHANSVESVAFSPDGSRLASASYDQTVKVWDVCSGEETLTLKGHTDAVESVCFSPDGKRIASGSLDRIVKVWDAAREQEALSLEGHGSPVFSVQFSPDGTRLATASRDKSVMIWDAHSGEETLTLKGHSHPVTGVCFSADGSRIVSRAKGTDDSVDIRSWDTSSGTLLPPDADPAPADNAGLSARSPGSRLVVSAQGSILLVRRLVRPSRVETSERTRSPSDSQTGARPAPSLEGHYFCTGTNPDGVKYGGITVEIQKRGDDFHLNWTGNGVNDEGGGTVVGAELVVTFKGTSGRGTVLYEIQNDSTLIGAWRPRGSKRAGEEILKPKENANPHPD